MKTARPVEKVDIDGNVVATYSSAIEAAKVEHYDVTAIRDRCRMTKRKRINEKFTYRYKE